MAGKNQPKNWVSLRCTVDFRTRSSRKTLPQQHGQHFTDRIFGLKVARVDQIQPAPARFLKLMVFEIRRHERITARRKHLIDRAAAAPAANGDTPHRSSGVGEPQPRTGQLSFTNAANVRTSVCSVSPIRSRP